LSFTLDAVDLADFIESTQIYVISFLSSSVHIKTAVTMKIIILFL